MSESELPCSNQSKSAAVGTRANDVWARRLPQVPQSQKHRGAQAGGTGTARERVRQYCTDQLTPEQSSVILEVMSALMATDQEHGHEQAEQIIQVIEAVRCKHDKIGVLIENARAARERVDRAERYNEQLEVLYKQRIQELQGEVQVYQSLESAVYGIAQRQLEKQPE
jgi:hypothetical protein